MEDKWIIDTQNKCHDNNNISWNDLLSTSISNDNLIVLVDLLLCLINKNILQSNATKMLVDNKLY